MQQQRYDLRSKYDNQSLPKALKTGVPQGIACDSGESAPEQGESAPEQGESAPEQQQGESASDSGEPATQAKMKKWKNFDQSVRILNDYGCASLAVISVAQKFRDAVEPMHSFDESITVDHFKTKVLKSFLANHKIVCDDLLGAFRGRCDVSERAFRSVESEFGKITAQITKEVEIFPRHPVWWHGDKCQSDGAARVPPAQTFSVRIYKSACKKAGQKHPAKKLHNKARFLQEKRARKQKNKKEGRNKRDADGLNPSDSMDVDAVAETLGGVSLGGARPRDGKDVPGSDGMGGAGQRGAGGIERARPGDSVFGL